MGTRADFYVGRGKQSEWIGSIAWDGDEIPEALSKCKTEKTYRKQLLQFLKSRDDSTFPENGWPWPWNDSNTTDVAYAFDNGRVYRAIGHPVMYWWRADQHHPNYVSHHGKRMGSKAEFPDMSEKKNVTLGKRSGLMVIGSNGPIDYP